MPLVNVDKRRTSIFFPTNLICGLKTEKYFLLFLTVILFSNPVLANYEGGLEGYEIGTQAKIDGLERVTQELVAPPFLPLHEQVATGEPRVIQIKMVIEEKEIEVESGVFIWAFTFNGSVPGPIIVAHENDYIELTLVNL